MLPILKNKAGPKVLLGDNLSSHINNRVLEKCEEHDIRFIFLPPNSTHLTQPLDVAFFRPLKVEWRKVLSQYKESSLGRNKTSLDKQHFPMLLKMLMERVMIRGKENLVSGFRKCSIYPINIEELFKGINTNSSSYLEVVEDSFKEYLENKTSHLFGNQTATRKRKKVSVPPGKSISLADVSDPRGEEPIEVNNSDVEDTPAEIPDIRSSTPIAVQPPSHESSSQDNITAIQPTSHAAILSQKNTTEEYNKKRKKQRSYFLQ